MTGAMSRRKGAEFERWLARKLQAAFPGLEIKRGFQYRDGSEAPDVDMPHLWIEAKRGRKPNVRAALRQAEEAVEDSVAAGGDPDRLPLAVIRDDRDQPFVAMKLDHFLALLELDNWNWYHRTVDE